MNIIKNTLTDFAVAWQLLTAIPLPLAPADSDRPPGYAATYFPLVGAALGLLLVAAAEMFFWLFPAGIAAALLLALWVGATGMLHLDGFMDSCDGLLPPREAARRLEIMKDSRVGAFGAVGGVLLLLLKFNGLAALPPTQRAAVLVVIPMLGRWTQTWAMVRYPLARPDGMGAFFQQGLTMPRVAAVSGGAALVTVTLLGWMGAGLLALAALTTALVARLAVARIGGLTGDVYGALCEIIETVLLVAVSVQSFSA